MPYQTPITIKVALDRIHRHEYVLPAIQREFVWRPDQICRLFDCLMRGYPVGSFLFWRVDRDNVRDYRFYGFVRDYHQRDNPHCPPLDMPPDHGVVAVLDGQQRLTAFNIGLRGSHAIKEPRKWWDNPEAFPRKRLYLNLLGAADENEEGVRYDFAFLAEDRAVRRTEAEFWFPVAKIREMPEPEEIYGYIVDHDLSANREVFRILSRLHKVVHTDGIITFYEEESQDIEKVLNIFIRTNSGGTVLSYSDLLLSIATAQWEKLDARSEIYGLVDELNDTRDGFALSKDFALKAGLMLCDIASVGFKVENFNRRNMAILEENWRRIADARRLTVRLIAGFGFSAQTLTADSALHTIAYYVYHRGLDTSYLTAASGRQDREAIRQWLIRSLLKPGVWGSGLDTLLTAIRAAVNEHGAERFPVEAIEAAMVRRGRSLRFEVDEVEDLADVAYGGRRAFGILALLYPFVDLRNEFHIDHVFPRSVFTPARLAKVGVPQEAIERYREHVNRLGNLQLLEGSFNRMKNDRLPHEWLAEMYEGAEQWAEYRDRHDLTGLPETIDGFEQFYIARRQRMTDKLISVLGAV